MKEINKSFAVIKSAYIIAGLALCTLGGFVIADGANDKPQGKNTRVESVAQINPTGKKVLGGALGFIGLELFTLIGVVSALQNRNRRKSPIVR